MYQTNWIRFNTKNEVLIPVPQRTTSIANKYVFFLACLSMTYLHKLQLFSFIAKFIAKCLKDWPFCKEIHCLFAIALCLKQTKDATHVQKYWSDPFVMLQQYLIVKRWFCKEGVNNVSTTFTAMKLKLLRMINLLYQNYKCQKFHTSTLKRFKIVTVLFPKYLKVEFFHVIVFASDITFRLCQIVRKL